LSGDEEVRAQYEAYPYPSRDPRDERRRLVSGSPSHPLEIDHYVFAGARDWSRPFRALVAGGGTGDATIMLAQGLADRNCPAEIVYLDVSAASRRIAEARAAERKLDNIRFVTGSLLDAAAHGSFDYIDCCGVLHHLADPDAGLAALAKALDPEGGIGLMVYGALGRTGVYPVQDLLRRLGGDVALARRVVADLPASNWLKRNPHLSDHLSSDAGVHDLLLHGRDRAYRVPELAALVAGAGLRIAGFIEKLRYEPESYVADPVLRRRLAALGPIDRAAAAEELSGALKSHVVYAVPAARGDTVARPDRPDIVPVLRDLDGTALAAKMAPGETLVADFGGHKVRFPLPILAPAILARIDGTASLEAIRQGLADPPGWDDFARAFEALYRVMNGLNRMLLRSPARNR
jgi:SAM-dependent methyltransferase